MSVFVYLSRVPNSYRFPVSLTAKLYGVTTALMIVIWTFKKSLLIVALLLVMKASALGALSLGNTLKT
jgi:hypothetical protein